MVSFSQQSSYLHSKEITMSEAQAAAGGNSAGTGENTTIFILEGEDGSSYKCQFLDRFELDGNDYAVLLKVAEGEEDEEELDEDEQPLVIMRVNESDSQTVFQVIESEEEFNKVVAFVEEMVEAESGAMGDEDEE